MDWLLDRPDQRSAERVLSGLGDHLRRHAAYQPPVDEAVQRVRSLLDATSAVGPARLHLDWTGERPRVSLARVTDVGGLQQLGLAAGEPVRAEHRHALADVVGEPVGEVVLEVPRRVQDAFAQGPPPMPAVGVDPRVDGVASVAVAMAAAGEAHPAASGAQLAALAGSALADVVARDTPVSDAASVAELFVQTHRAMGGDPVVVDLRDDVVELAVRHCPFGDGVTGAETLCRVSTALAGRLGARVRGEATVVLDETIAAGDDECHLQLWLGDPAEEVRGERHRWPPAAGSASGSAPQLELSVNLPREGGSVPVVRRLAAQALRSFGVTEHDVDEVQLAITEACANVIDHAAESETYEVMVELAADRCAITVVDQGGGFDATAVPADAHDHAESGRGMALMRALVDNVDFTSQPQAGAVVHMVKTLGYDRAHPLWRRRED
ncbi:MAG TPA: ATP-binding protein [Motilibacteraceae bacterium]|nr:ATP-binding protein [Motilibacteraceae bacterium]